MLPLSSSVRRMTDFLALASLVTFLVWIAIPCMGFRDERNFIAALLRDHHETCVRHGVSGRPFRNFSMSFSSFVLRQRYRSVGDSSLSRLGDRVRVRLIASLVSFSLWVVIGMAELAIIWY
jgi:hypothetical protein